MVRQEGVKQSESMKQSGHASGMHIRITKPPSEVREEGLDWSTISQSSPSRFKEPKTKVKTGGRMAKTFETLSTSKNMKTSQNMLRRELSQYVKSKLVRYCTFRWVRHSLQLQIRVVTPTSLDPPSYELEGREVAVKRVHAARGCGERAVATELMLIRYREANLANLQQYNLEGLSKIYLEHIFVKNNDDLYARYRSSLSLSDMDRPDGVSYRQLNGFFEGRLAEMPQLQLRQLYSKHSNKEEQKRYQYADIIAFARKCCLPF